ncbi:hypothetical protein BH20PSE1_BH20PSE1_25700 [soil metagenome]
MTTVFPRDDGKVDTVSAGTHVLIVAVGGYPHLLGGDTEQLVKNPMGLAQLTSPPASAQALADWFLGRQADLEAKYRFHNPKAPLASIEMLVSPPWTAKDKAQPYGYPLAGGGAIAVDGAGRRQIGTCYVTWRKRVNANQDNIGVFYFCGHGVTGLNDYVLAEDFGQDSNPWLDAIDIAVTARAARREVNGALYFFIDACRDTKREALNPGVPAQPLQHVDFGVPVQCLSRLMLWATGEGSSAHGAEGKPSRFTAALIQALSGFYGEALPEGPGWVVSSAALPSAVDRILEQDNLSLEAHLHQHMEMERIGSQPFHYEMERPQTVATTVSIAYVDPHVRKVLDALPGADRLSPMVKETIAESVESGRIAVEQLQQEVNRWLQNLTEWARRFAAEPDREVAEAAGALLAAGKLDEAGALVDELIRVAEARVTAEHERLASYHASRADVLVLQLKWREAVPYLEKAIASAKQVYGDTPHPAMAIHLNNLGAAWNSLGEYRKAIDYFTQALAMAQKVHGDTPHPAVATFLNNLGLAWNSLGEYRTAIDYSTQALAMDQKVYGDTPHPDVAAHLNNLGLAWNNLGEYRKAIDYYTQALAMFEATLPNDHPSIQIVRASLRQAQKAQAAATK